MVQEKFTTERQKGAGFTRSNSPITPSPPEEVPMLTALYAPKCAIEILILDLLRSEDEPIRPAKLRDYLSGFEPWESIDLGKVNYWLAKLIGAGFVQKKTVSVRVVAISITADGEEELIRQLEFFADLCK